MMRRLPMLQIAKSPLGRRLWRLARIFNRPVSELGSLTLEELEFCDFAIIAEDPKLLEKYENTYRDPEFDAFERAFDEATEQREQEKTLMRRREEAELRAQGYDVPAESGADDEWERVD